MPTIFDEMAAISRRIEFNPFGWIQYRRLMHRYIIVPLGAFGEQTSRISPTAFSDKIDSNSKKNKTKTNRMMVGLKIGPTTFETKISSAKRSRQNTKCLVLDLSVLW